MHARVAVRSDHQRLVVFLIGLDKLDTRFFFACNHSKWLSLSQRWREIIQLTALTDRLIRATSVFYVSDRRPRPGPFAVEIFADRFNLLYPRSDRRPHALSLSRSFASCDNYLSGSGPVDADNCGTRRSVRRRGALPRGYF